MGPGSPSWLIPLNAWRDDLHCYVDLIGVSPARGGLRDVFSALATVEQAMQDKHTKKCNSHRFDFLPVSFSVLNSFGPALQELLDLVCREYHIHAQVPEWEAHTRVYCILSSTTIHGVADIFVARRFVSFG